MKHHSETRLESYTCGKPLITAGQRRVYGSNFCSLQKEIDTNVYPFNFKITGGNVHDSQFAGELIELIGQAYNFIVDIQYDSETIRVKGRNYNIISVIHKRTNAK